MKVRILSEYEDKKLEKRVKVGDVLDLDDERIEQLIEVGIDMEEYSEDEESEDENTDTDTDDLDEESEDENVLVEAYKNDKNIVNKLLATDLKTLCEAFDINYTNVADAKEALKIVTFG